MTVKVAVDNEHKLFISYFHGAVETRDVHDSLDQLLAGASPGVYRALVIFARQVDLAAWDGDALRKLRADTVRAYRQLGLQRGDSAAVLGFAPEAQLVMRVWNALCYADYDIEMAFSLFVDLESAFRFLAAPPAVRRRVYELMAPAPV